MLPLFQRSSLGAFVKSPLCARNSPQSGFVGLIIYTDESTVYWSSPTFFAAECTTVTNYLATYKYKVKIVLVQILPLGTARPIPTGYEHLVPTQVQIVTQSQRSPTLEEHFHYFNMVLKPHHLLLRVDNSGSMDTSTMEPVFSEFLTSLHANYPETIQYYTAFSDERWLFSILQALELANIP